MTSSTNFEHIDDFLETIGTVDVDHENSVGSIMDAGTASNNKIYIRNEKIIGVDHGLKRYTMRYDLDFLIDTDANYKTLFESLMTNIYKFNARIAIDGYTRPSRMLNVSLDPSGYRNKNLNGYKGKYYLRVVWSV